MLSFRKEAWSFLLVIAFVGVALAATTNISNDSGGWHRVSLLTSSSTFTPDTGIGFFRVPNDALLRIDTAVEVGFFFSNSNSNGLSDTRLASHSAGAGNAKALSGLIPGLASGSANATNGTLYVQISDTSRITATVVFGDSATSSGTWSSSLTGRTGTESSTFFRSPSFSSRSVVFGDSPASSANTLLINQLQRAPDTAFVLTSNAVETVIRATVGSDPSRADSMRLIVIAPNGLVTRDTFMIRSGVNGSDSIGFTTQGNVRLELGKNQLILVYWDAGLASYKFHVGQASIVAERDVLAGGTGVADLYASTDSSQVASCTVTVASATSPVINAIELADNSNDTIALGDSYASVDSNTASFDTRVAGSVFTVTLLAADSSRITQLTSGSCSMVVTIRPGQVDSSGLKLVRRDPATNAWEIAGTSQSVDAATGKLTVLGMTKFSEFALVGFSGSTVSISSGSCVLERVAGESLMLPRLRAFRDRCLSSRAGRILVELYYLL